MLNAGWGTTFFDLPTPKYILWNHFRPFLIDFDFFLILIFESENRLVNPQCTTNVLPYNTYNTLICLLGREEDSDLVFPICLKCF